MNVLRARISLFARMAVAAGVLAVLSLLIAALSTILVVLAGILSWAVLVEYHIWGWIVAGFVALSSLPGPSTVTSLSPSVVVVGAGIGLVGGYGWSVLARRIFTERFLPTVRSVTATGLKFGCLYLVVAEGSTALLIAFGQTESILTQLAYLFAVSAILVVAIMINGSRNKIRSIRETVVDDSVPASETDPGLEATVTRLTQQVGVPTPDVYVTETDRAESFTLGSGDTAIVVVSRGLLETLSRAELEAVLAHEVSHLANWDSRLMSAAIVPVMAADDWIVKAPTYNLDDLFYNAVFGVLKLFSQLGVAILSRGREWHADAGAVELVGSPAPLASALMTLEETRRTPTTDLREWEESVVALDILPPETDDLASGPFRTHPSTGKRIARLRRLAARRT